MGFLVPVLGRLGVLMAVSWVRLGYLLGCLGYLMGAFWELLGAALGALRGHVWPLEAPKRIFKKRWFSSVFPLLLASGEGLRGLLGRSLGLLERLGGVLEVS